MTGFQTFRPSNTPSSHATDGALRTPSRSMRRAALVLLQLGVLAVALAVVPFKAFELDRFFVPKELTLHAVAVLAGLCCVWGVRRFVFDRVDTLLITYSGISVLSALFTTNHAASTRAVAVTLSGLVVFWAARAVAGSGLRRPLVIAIVTAVVVGAGTGLLQAYGLRTEYASLSRAPGGTSGNRNFMAHLCVIGMPLLLWSAVTSRRVSGMWLGAVASMTLGAALVLSRSRAAWVALAVCGVLLLIPTWLAVRRLRDEQVGRRFVLLGVSMAVGGLAALALPNRLNWKSDSPYLDSVKGVVDYSSGSGRGRLIQYKNTLRMVVAHPVLGVGPGNWPVYYPKFASRTDPSLSRETGRPSNPWPSSDWVAMIAERGPIATVAFLLAYLGLFVSGWRRAGDEQATDIQSAMSQSVASQLAPLALMGTMIVTAVVGAFDAVLLLSAPTMIVWGALGALSTPGTIRAEWAPESGTRRRWLAVAALVGMLFVARSSVQILAMANNCSGWSAVTLDRCQGGGRQR